MGRRREEKEGQQEWVRAGMWKLDLLFLLPAGLSPLATIHRSLLPLAPQTTFADPVGSFAAASKTRSMPGGTATHRKGHHGQAAVLDLLELVVRVGIGRRGERQGVEGAAGVGCMGQGDVEREKQRSAWGSRLGMYFEMILSVGMQCIGADRIGNRGGEGEVLSPFSLPSKAASNPNQVPGSAWLLGLRKSCHLLTSTKLYANSMTMLRVPAARESGRVRVCVHQHANTCAGGPTHAPLQTELIPPPSCPNRPPAFPSFDHSLVGTAPSDLA
jgi:hypothetical protein